MAMPPLTDEEIAHFMRLTPGEATAVLPLLSPHTRALFDRFRDLVRFDIDPVNPGLPPPPPAIEKKKR